MPSRSHPRRRKKNKATKGQPIKGTGSNNSKDTHERDSSDMESTDGEEEEEQRELDHNFSGASRVEPQACSSKSLAMESASSQEYGEEANQSGMMDSQTLSTCSQADSGYGLSQDSQEEADEIAGSSSKMDATTGTASTTTTSTSITSTRTTKTLEKNTGRPSLSRSQSFEEPSSKVTRDSLERSATLSSSKADLLCNFCLTKKKNAGIIHGRIVHQICCYPCAKKLYKRKEPCPLCRRKIEKICQVIVG